MLSFEFGSHANYCLFRWFVERSEIDLDALIDKAIEADRNNDDRFVLLDAADQLAELLEEELVEELQSFATLDFNVLCPVDDQLPYGDTPCESLLGVLVNCVALRGVRLRTVAKAILRHAGKAPVEQPLPVPL